MELLLNVDTADEAYWQKYPFGGPSSKKNGKVLNRLRAGKYPVLATATARVPYKALALEFLGEWEQSSHFRFNGESAPVRALIPNGVVERAFQWKALAMDRWVMDRSRRNVKRILSLGVGTGAELRVLRTMFADADIVAVDWVSKCDPALSRDLSVSIVEADLVDFVARQEEKFDLVFSNHVLEHMYRIDDVIASSAKCLRDDGALVASLPLCLEPSPYARRMLRMLERSSRIKLLDLILFDFGHPWKVDESALAARFAAHGFGDISVAKCSNMLVRNQLVSGAGCRARQALSVAGYEVLDLVKAPVSLLLETAMRNELPGWPFALKLFYAVESRLPIIAGNRIANFVPEALVLASKGTAAAS